MDTAGKLPAKPRRRWFQFSLRTLLIVTALAACGSWLAVNWSKAKEQRIAVAAIQFDGGIVGYGGPYEPRPSRPKWLPEEFMTTATHVNYGQRDCLASIVLKPLKTLRTLECLNLQGVYMTDHDLSLLSGITSLRELHLNDHQITNAGLRSIQGMNGLRILDLANTSVSDGGMEYLQDMFQLESLNLQNTYLTDGSMRYLQKLTRLNNLRLCNISITDAGLQQLASLINLCHLDIGGTDVTNEGIARLQAALPKCRIVRFEPYPE